MTCKLQVANQRNARKHGYRWPSLKSNLKLSLSPNLNLNLAASQTSSHSKPLPYAAKRIVCLLLIIMAHLVASAAATATAPAATTSPAVATSSPPARPRALVYRWPAGGEGLSEAVARLLESSPRNFDVQYAGPGEALDVSPESLSAVELYAQPGGPDLDDAWAQTKAYAPSIREFVSRGGRYLGFCLGAYLAGHTPGFGLLPRGADTDAENDQKGAQVTTDIDTIIQIDWKFMTGLKAGQTAENRWIYFQEGAVIKRLKENETAFVLARYSKSGGIAASLNKYGDGWVGLIGPHPEATQDWFDAEDIRSPDGLQFDIGYDLIEAVMTGGGNATKLSDSVLNGSGESSASKRRNPLSRLFKR